MATATTLSTLPEGAYGRLEDAIDRLGAEYGHAAGSWIIDGNTTAETARRVLREIEDCEFEIRSPLSAAYADDPDAESVVREAARYANVDFELADRDDDDDTLDQLAMRFIDAYTAAFEHEVERSARAMLGEVA